MSLKELYDYYGSWADMMRSLNLGSTTYQAWLRKKMVPWKTQLIIENKTQGKFKADLKHSIPGSCPFNERA